MSDNEFDKLREKFSRTLRSNLNELLDRINDFEDARRGGDGGWEHIGMRDPQELRPRSSEKTLRDYYANLECEYGADMDTVKASYRRLMRKYHPDKFASDPQMEELSTELTQELTHAYQAIESYWKTGRL